ncbi:hypothetical protein LCGC14_0918290 [marine sediment metagenome]|uniref:Uncharacterized protein n=1 Tax=marine sediment metagenome TaxID=412755 RepID=A0A0F9PCA0_9ZZZZ|nr:hypothetical protein [bacterium]
MKTLLLLALVAVTMTGCFIPTIEERTDRICDVRQIEGYDCIVCESPERVAISCDFNKKQ